MRSSGATAHPRVFLLITMHVAFSFQVKSWRTRGAVHGAAGAGAFSLSLEVHERKCHLQAVVAAAARAEVRGLSEVALPETIPDSAL